MSAPRNSRRGQGAANRPDRRLPPIDELIHALEFEEVAKLRLPAAAYAAIAGSDRSAFERMTFRPRMMVPTLDLDLSVDLLGEKHFSPMLIGPVADQRQYHPEGEIATVRGASTARTAVIVSSRSSIPIAEIAAQARTPLWYAVYPASNARRQAEQAVAAGCTALCITIGASFDGVRGSASPRTDWKTIEQIGRGLTVPLVIKGVMTPEDAKTAIRQGARGIVVSNHGGVGAGKAAPIEVLSSIADAAVGQATVMIDGSFRRGTDILKALLLGAQGVLLARPVMWGLAAYGAVGVQQVIELLQSDLGRNMASIGAPNPASLTRSMLRIHR